MSYIYYSLDDNMIWTISFIICLSIMFGIWFITKLLTSNAPIDGWRKEEVAEVI